MGTQYYGSGGSGTNGGSSDNDAADLSGSAATNAAAVITLDGSPDLSGVSTSGATQAAIYLAGVTVYNTDSRIFWITAVDNVLKTVTVTPTPGGTASGVWAIGGRVNTPQLAVSPLRAGDEAILNDNYSVAGTTITTRVAGTGALPIKITGKSGAKRVLSTTNTSTCVSQSHDAIQFRNLELDQQGASGLAFSTASAAAAYLEDVKISNAGGHGFQVASGTNNVRLDKVEISGCGDDGINIASAGSWFRLMRAYIHDNTGDGFHDSTGNPKLDAQYAIFDTNAARGAHFSGSVTTWNSGVEFLNCVFYGNGNSGIEGTDADLVFHIFNCIFMNNGDAAGEYNFEFAGTIENNGAHGYNIFYDGGAGDNVTGLTVSATELTTDPLFTDPANGDFTLQSSSPALGVGTPGTILGATGTGYMDIGPFQRQASGGGGTTIAGTPMRRGMV